MGDDKLAARLRGMTDGQKLDAALSMLVRIDKRLARLEGDGGAGRAGGAPAVAADAELDTASGDEEIRKDPKRWEGESFQGKRMSACPPEYLDVLADFAEWAADKSLGKAKQLESEGNAPGAHKERTSARYKAATARRARGWAARARARAAEDKNREDW